MKNATKHGTELKALLKKLQKGVKLEPIEPIEPLRALVKGGMAFDAEDKQVEQAMAVIDREFVDLNELRVATDLEIKDMLGGRYPQIEKRVSLITQALNAIFEREQTLNLERLKTMKKAEVRQFLRDLPEMNPFVEAYVMLMAFESAAVPVDNSMAAYLRAQGVLEDDASLEEAQKFLEHQLKADECYPFYVVVRSAAMESGGRKK